MEPEGSLPYSQVPATCPYPEPAQSSPYLHIPLLEDPSQYYPPIYAWVSQVVSFLQISPSKPCLHPLLSPLCTTCPTHLILLDFITQIILVEEYRSLNSSLGSFLRSPFTSSLLGPDILLSTLFSNTFSLHSSLNLSEQVSHSYKTTGKTILIFKFLEKGLLSDVFAKRLYIHFMPIM